MYPVSEVFNAHMKADLRRIDAKVVIDYTDPKIDQSLTVTASEQANVSYPQQTADGVTQVTHKWASLDGSWTLDGTWHLAPEPDDLARYQFGWWGSQLAGVDGAFSEPYPSLTITHIPRPVHTLRVGGDSARREWPVDFSIDLYGPDDVLLYSETVTGNAAVEWSKALPTPVLDVARQVLTLTRWSHAGRQAKILEFFTSIQETYYSGDVIEIRLLEEREASQGSLPVGNISSNEISLRLANESGKFDVTNRQSPLWGLLKPNRRIRAWLGLRGAGDLWGDGWYAPFDRDLAVARRDGAVQEPLPGYVATLRPGEGRFGGAVAVEEGTTNLVPSNSLKFEGWTAVSGAQVTLTQNVEFPEIGRNDATRIRTTGGTSTLKYYRPIEVSIADQAYTGSVYIKNIGSKPVRFYTQFGPRVIVNSGEWTRAVASGIGNGTAQFQLRFEGLNVDDDLDFIAWGPQAERKPFATSFVDGTRAAGRLEYPQNIWNHATGTFAAWVKTPTDVSTDRVLTLQWANDAVGPDTRFGIRMDTSGRFVVSYGSADTLITADSYNDGEWHHVALTWVDGTADIHLYVDGERVASASRPISVNNPGGRYRGVIPIGHRGYTYNNQWWNGLIDELLILPYAASEEHIARLYTQTRPLYDEWVPLGTFWSLDWDSPDDTLEAQVRARDRLELLRKGTYQPGAVQQNVSLYTLAEQVLQDAGLQPGEYAIDTALQSTVVPWAWLSPTSHREALRIIAEAALAVVYADRDGVVRIETMGSMPADPVLTITADDYFPPLSAPSRQDQVANEIVVTTQPLRPEDQQEVYKSTTPVTVPAGQTITVTVQYTKRPVIEAQAALDNQPPGVSIVAATYYAWGAGITLQNSGATQADVSLVVTGRPLSVQGGEQVVARDEQSITENGVLRYQYPDNPLVQTLQQAQAIAQALLASAKDPRRDIEVEWRGNPALELGDRVTVVDQDVHVIRQEINWAGALSARIVGRRVS